MDLSTSLHEPDAPEVSTQIDTGTRAPNEATPAKEVEKPAKESRLDAIKRAAADTQPKEAEKPAKEEAPADDAKPADEATAEPAKGDAEPKEAQAEADKAKPEKQRRQPIEAPEKFLPRAKELWNNTPHEVRSEMQRLIAEADGNATAVSETAKEYEALRPYADMAKQSGTSLDQALGRYVQMEQTLRADPANGLKMLMQNMQMSPVQAIGHIMVAHNVRPEQLAEHIMQSPNEYTALARPQPQTQPAQQQNGEVIQLRQQVAQLAQQAQQRDIHAQVIEPFARENPRYHELEPTIAQFLNSDMVPKTLGLHDRLAAAYDMAVRVSPSATVAPKMDAQQVEEADSRAGKDFGGTKSVRGAPASGSETTNRAKGKVSRVEALKQASAALGFDL